MDRSRIGRVCRHAALTVALAAGVSGLAAPAQASGAPQWRQVAQISIRGADVLMIGISAPAADDAWALGEAIYSETVKPVVDHWNGVRWRDVRLPSAILRGFGGTDLWSAFGASSDGSVWAFTTNGHYLRLARGHWSTGVLPIRGGREIEAVKVFSQTDMWVFGTSFGAGFYAKAQPYAARFDGRRWRVVRVPDTGDINAVSAVSPDDMYALSGLSAGVAPRVLHWNGHSWRVLPPPVHDRDAALYTILAQGHSCVYVGGNIAKGKHATAAVIERWNGQSWADVTPRSAPAGDDVFVYSLAPGRHGIWAVSVQVSSNGSQVWHRVRGTWSRPVTVPWSPGLLAAIPGTRSIWATGAVAAGGPGHYRGVIDLHGPTPGQED